MADRYKTGEKCPKKGNYDFDGYVNDDGRTPAPTAEEKRIPMDVGDTFPPIKSQNKSCWWKLGS